MYSRNRGCGKVVMQKPRLLPGLLLSSVTLMRFYTGRLVGFPSGRNVVAACLRSAYGARHGGRKTEIMIV